MSANPDAAMPSAAADSNSPPRAAAQRKPRFALFIATACGLGYIPVAPGTWGSLAGLLLALVPLWTFGVISWSVIAMQRGDRSSFVFFHFQHGLDPFLGAQIGLAAVVAVLGVWSGTRAATAWNQKDPQRVVIDEVSGQHLALLLGCGVPIWWKAYQFPYSGDTVGLISLQSPLNWKYFLLGFILFRIFDIWKPFPARQAESLPGGWGIMADDWVAGVYAAIGLWLARAAGL